MASALQPLQGFQGMEGRGRSSIVPAGPGAGPPAVHKASFQRGAMADVPLWPRKDRVTAASSEAVLFNQCLI